MTEKKICLLLIHGRRKEKRMSIMEFNQYPKYCSHHDTWEQKAAGNLIVFQTKLEMDKTLCIIMASDQSASCLLFTSPCDNPHYNCIMVTSVFENFKKKYDESKLRK